MDAMPICKTTDKRPGKEKSAGTSHWLWKACRLFNRSDDTASGSVVELTPVYQPLFNADRAGNPDIKPDRVLFRDGALWLAGSAEASTPITLGKGSATLADGWKVTKVYAEAQTFRIIDLLKSTGETSFWILDADGRILGNHHDFSNWDADNPHLCTISSHIQELAAPLIDCPVSEIDQRLQSFYELSEPTRSALSKVLQQAKTEVKVVDLLDEDNDRSWTIPLKAGSISVQHDRLMKALHIYLDKQFLEALHFKTLKWPSLHSQDKSEVVHCIFFDYSAGVLRVVEPGTQLVFYVVFEGADLIPTCIFIPACMTVFGWSTGPQNTAFSRLSSHPDWIINCLRDTLLRAPGEVLPWLKLVPQTTGQCLWPGEVAHLGHYIWNELTGIGKIVRDIPREHLPIIWNLASNEQSSFYGALEDLYPEIKGHVRTAIPSMRELFAHSVRTGTQFVRVSGDFVTEDIRNRIHSVSSNDPDTKITAKLSQSLVASSIPVLILGLRCRTRTIRDLPSFYCHLIDAIHEQAGDFVVVIDGLNSAPGAPRGSTFQVFVSGKSSMGPMDLERDIADEITRHCEQRGLVCIDCIGTSIKQNLYWINRANFFVAIWGGGLAKYRWAANIPGYALTNRHNLNHPFILSIYHADRFTEAASHLYYPELSWVTDVADANHVGDGRQSDAMFEVSVKAINDIVKRFKSHTQGRLPD